MAIDLVTIKEQLDKFWVLERIWWMTYLAEITEITPFVTNYKEYLNIIVEKYKLRILGRIWWEIWLLVDKDESPEFIIGKLEKWINELINTIGWKNSTVKRVHDLFLKRYNELAEMVENPLWIKKRTSYTWWIWLDNLLWWMHWGNLVIIAARPAMWKTATALNICDYNIRKWKNVAFFSLEMSERELSDRMISFYSDVNWFKLRTWEINRLDLDNIAEWIDEVSESNLYVDTDTWINIDSLRLKLINMNMSSKLDLVIVDYLQLMKEPWYKNNRVQEISEISRQLKLLAKEFDVPIIALSQLSRAVENRPDKRPIMSDLRDSWSIEQDADSIIFLYREEAYDEYTERKNIIDFVVRKNRHWAIGEVPLLFNKVKQKITNLEKYK
jgi:replicative DNA helicase